MLKCRWEASSESPGLGDLYLSVMDALDTIDSSAIYFLEGAGQQSFVTAWGDGFVTDGGIISQYGLSDPRPFFDALVEKPYVDRVRWPGFMHADSCVCDGLPEQRSFVQIASANVPGGFRVCPCAVCKVLVFVG